MSISVSPHPLCVSLSLHVFVDEPLSHSTLFAEGGQGAPGEVQLAAEGVLAHQVVARVTLVGDASPPDQRRVRRGLPAVLDLRQVRTRVVTGHLWIGLGRKQMDQSEQGV